MVAATFCFVDLAGYSALTEAHGPHSAADLALAFERMTRDALGDDGELVDLIGDAVFVTAPAPVAALGFLDRLWHQALGELGFPVLRAGLHHGEAARRGARWFGSAVNVAARIAARAGGGEILGSAPIADAARSRGIPVVALGPVALRNIVDPVELFALTIAPATEHAIDPVCRMQVSREHPVGRVRVGEREYLFCSLDCTHRFTARPDAYLPAP